MTTVSIIKQISVFLQNEAGRTYEVTRILAEKGINILAFNLAESGDFGLLRLIVDNEQAATAALKEAHIAAFLTEVVSVNCPNKTGSLTRILNHLAAHDISFDYMYAFQYEGLSAAVIRPQDLDACLAVLQDYR